MSHCSPTSLFSVSSQPTESGTLLTTAAWIRIIFCQGPQKAINAITLYSVFKANLDPTTATNVGQGFLDFFQKIEVLASQDHQQAVILSGMVFTLIVWIFGALSLILGVLFYVFFLWHYIPNADGGLSGYCERKINSRLAKIVSAKVNKALEEEERKRRKADQKAIKNGDVPIGRQATIPMLFDAKDDKLPNMPMLSRNDTMATLPLYSSRPGTPSSALPAFELDRLDQKRPLPSRNATGNSNRSYASNASLLGNASDMGYGRPASPAPSLPPLDTSGFPAAPQRTMTNNSQNSPWNRGPPVGPPRMPSAMGDRGYTQSPVSYTDIGSQRSPSAIRQDPIDPYNRPMPGGNPSIPGVASMGRRTPFDPYSPDGRSSPAPGPGVEYGRSSPAPGLSGPPAPQFPSNGNSNYVAYGPEQRSISAAPYNPNQRSTSASPYNMDQRSASAAPYNSNQRSTPAAVPSYASGQGQQFRNMTDPSFRALPSASNGPPLNPQMGAMGMSSSPVNGGRGTPNGSREREGPARLASPAPYVNNLNGRGSPQEYGPSQGGLMGAPRAPYRQ